MQNNDSQVSETENITKELSLKLSTTARESDSPALPTQHREGLGFRPKSGLNTPQVIQEEEGRENASPIPDQYGLGWPGL